MNRHQLLACASAEMQTALKTYTHDDLPRTVTDTAAIDVLSALREGVADHHDSTVFDVVHKQTVRAIVLGSEEVEWHINLEVSRPGQHSLWVLAHQFALVPQKQPLHKGFGWVLHLARGHRPHQRKGGRAMTNRLDRELMDQLAAIRKTKRIKQSTVARRMHTITGAAE